MSLHPVKAYKEIIVAEYWNSTIPSVGKSHPSTLQTRLRVGLWTNWLVILIVSLFSVRDPRYFLMYFGASSEVLTMFRLVRSLYTNSQWKFTFRKITCNVIPRVAVQRERGTCFYFIRISDRSEQVCYPCNEHAGFFQASKETYKQDSRWSLSRSKVKTWDNVFFFLLFVIDSSKLPFSISYGAYRVG